MEGEVALGCGCGEVWGGVAESECHTDIEPDIVTRWRTLAEWWWEGS